jgi:Polyketide cyclase / dehydrase and lipid transport
MKRYIKYEGDIGTCLVRIFYLQLLLISSCFAANKGSPFDLKVFVGRSGPGFQVQASYVAPVNECQAYAFLTDYEGAKNIPGIRDSKVLVRTGNKVQVERIAEERVLFYPILLRSVLEFSEVSDKRQDFIQIEGDAKSYKGSWTIEPDKNGTRFTHLATFELDTSIPFFLIRFFIENSATRRFEVMAERVLLQKNTLSGSCGKFTLL